MANYYGTARSNYVRVKDSEAFLQWTSRRKLGVFKSERGPDVFAIHPGETTDGFWPSYDFEADVEFSLTAELAEHLPKGQVAILLEVGAEALRYLTGEAIAVNHTGRVVVLSLNDIYFKAVREFRVTESEITRAEY